MDVSISAQAFQTLYSEGVALVIGQAVTDRIAAQVPDTISLYTLDASGMIALADSDRADEAAAPMGMPQGILGFVVSGAAADAAQAWMDFARSQDVVTCPPLLLLEGPEDADIAAFLRFLATELATTLRTDRDRLGKKEQELIHLRRNAERARLTIEKARRLMQGIGYDTRTNVYEVAPGAETLGPGGDVDQSKVKQTLPVELAGLAAVSFHVAMVPADAAGSIEVTLTNAGDGSVVGIARVNSSELRPGWVHFGFDRVLAAGHADAEATIAWIPGPTGPGPAPLLSLGTGPADRFGLDGSDRTLALQIWKGLVDDQAPAIPPDAPAARKVMKSFKFPDVISSISYIFGPEQEHALNTAHQFQILTVDEAGGFLQTHPIQDGIAGALLPAFAPTGSHRVRTEISIAHASAPDFRFVLMLVPVSLTSRDDLLRDHLSELAASKAVHVADKDKETGMVWSSKVLRAGEADVLEIIPDAALTEPHDIICAALPVTDQVSFGWCRWHSLSIGLDGPDHYIPFRPAEAS